MVSLLTLPISLAVIVAGERLLRRLLPLALLLKLSLLFPDEVPNRLGTALRAASPKRLLAKLETDDLEEVSVAERIITLVAALNAHDRRTRGHSERVRALTMLVADEVGIVGVDRDKLEWAALLHDLGKLEVPAEILNKKGRPSDEEWLVLRQHPGAGPSHAGDLADWLGEWIHAMDQHHERFDGTGYPLGLAAGDIAMSGRIVAVADAFEVMTATRSYKVPMSTQAARSELVKCSGSHFDPAVVRNFMAVSLGDIHGALGPTSWIASLPFSGVAAPIATIGNAIVGGSVTPALAAAAALTILTGSASIHVPNDDGQASIQADRVAVTQSLESGEVYTDAGSRSGLINGAALSGLGSGRPDFGNGPLLAATLDPPEIDQDTLSPPPVPDLPDPLVEPPLDDLPVPTLPPLPPSPVDDTVDGLLEVVDPLTGIAGDVVDPVTVVASEVVGEVVGLAAPTVDPLLDQVSDPPETLATVTDSADELLGALPETTVATENLVQDTGVSSLFG